MEVQETGKKQYHLERLKPYLLSIFTSFCQAGFNIITKVCLENGMSRFVLAAYGFAIAAVITSLLTLLFQRNKVRKLTVPICLNISLLGLLGVSGKIMLFTALGYTSAAFAAALMNLAPPMTFLLATVCRMEKLDIAKLSGQAKIGGTALAFGGATLMTLYKGITVFSIHSPHDHQNAASKAFSDKNLMKGSLLLVAQSFISAVYFILQTKTIKGYPAPLALTALTRLAATLVATVIAVIIDHEASAWRLSWDITLLAPLYNGIMILGLTVYVQTVVIQCKGPVFMIALRPLTVIIVAPMGLLILGEALQLGGIIGAILIVIGSYAILWGKKVEEKRSMEPPICEQDVEIKSEK
ncbi:WAT1-related protein At5g07050 [Ricinus communis]|uniref:WAT1-related protein At5g07050 n=1 Tax=Ricinus communis TaxID=3988 RepID=UPI00201AC3AD|nr:WAT1-related protein At5g07050 [Ricinus communis]